MVEPIALAAVAIVAWFAIGSIWNLRKASAVMRRLQEGLPALGGRATVRWLGTTAVEMGIRDAREPFSAVAIVIFLEPRDLPWWPLSRLRGRRDTLIVRASLRRAPGVELEAIDPASWSGREASGRIPEGWPIREPADAGALAVHYAGAEALARADALLAQARRAGLVVWRLAVRRAEPHFQVHLALPDASRPARELFDALIALSELARG